MEKPHKNTLWHINWGDGDNFYIVAPSKVIAVKGMPEGKDMVNYAVRLDETYKTIFQQARQETAREICKAYDSYVKLLGEEIDTLAPLAIAHGWRSVREETGKECREKIEVLKTKYIK